MTGTLELLIQEIQALRADIVRLESKLAAQREPSQREPSQCDGLPATGLLRQKQILGDPKATPPIPAIIPLAASTWWAGVKDGRFPQPIRLGRTTVWRVEDIRQLLER